MFPGCVAANDDHFQSIVNSDRSGHCLLLKKKQPTYTAIHTCSNPKTLRLLLVIRKNGEKIKQTKMFESCGLQKKKETTNITSYNLSKLHSTNKIFLPSLFLFYFIVLKMENSFCIIPSAIRLVYLSLYKIMNPTAAKNKRIRIISIPKICSNGWVIACTGYHYPIKTCKEEEKSRREKVKQSS